MIKVYILTAQMVGGWAMMPMPTEAACLAALAVLHPAIVQSAECYPMEMMINGSRYAPEMSPLPRPKPGRRA